MKIPKIQSATVLRNHLFETLREVSEGEPQIVTHKAGDEVILLSKARYNKMAEAEEQNRVLRAIAEGREDFKQGNVVDHDDAKKFLQSLLKK